MLNQLVHVFGARICEWLAIKINPVIVTPFVLLLDYVAFGCVNLRWLGELQLPELGDAFD